MEGLTIGGALLVGFFGSSHCLGMCCGLTAALGLNDAGAGQRLLLSYNLGRLCSYGLMGALLGLFGSQLIGMLPVITGSLRVVAGLLLVLMGLYVSQWWLGLGRIEQLGQQLWRAVQPLTRGLLPINSHGRALKMGLLWGLLPCGLVYSTLAMAMLAGQWQRSGLLMLAFGVGTLPAMLSAGLINQQLLARLRSRHWQQLAGLVIMLMGLATIVMPWLYPATHMH